MPAYQEGTFFGAFAPAGTPSDIVEKLHTALNEINKQDRKSTRLNSSHTVIYTLSLHDALPIYARLSGRHVFRRLRAGGNPVRHCGEAAHGAERDQQARSEEHTSELQSHSDLHSFPTRRSSDLCPPIRKARFSAPSRRREPRPTLWRSCTRR